jgi:hypothetical protein
MMNSDALAAPAAILSPARRWTGAALTGLLVAFLIFDGVTKIIQVAPVVEASTKLGLDRESIPWIGVVLLVCTALYAIPATAILGSILLTGYLGGAAAVHVLAKSGAFPIVFSIGFGALAWAGLVLRDPRMLGWILRRRGN